MTWNTEDMNYLNMIQTTNSVLVLSVEKSPEDGETETRERPDTERDGPNDRATAEQIEDSEPEEWETDSGATEYKIQITMVGVNRI